MTGLEMPVPFSRLRPDRAPDFVIGDPARPYMLRWWLVPRNDVFNIYYHRILRDDDDRALHDHPWPSFSIMVSGRMTEVTPEGERLLRAGDCVYRGADFAHRLQLAAEPLQPAGPVETLFITGPKVRDWGFRCPGGFVPWRDFVGDGSGDLGSGQIGRGCGEMA